MPGDPEGDQLRTLEGVGREGITDLGIEIPHALRRGRETLGHDVLVKVVVAAGPAVDGYPDALDALALLAAELEVLSHGSELIARLRQPSAHEVKPQVGRPTCGGHGSARTRQGFPYRRLRRPGLALIALTTA